MLLPNEPGLHISCILCFPPPDADFMFFCFVFCIFHMFVAVLALFFWCVLVVFFWKTIDAFAPSPGDGPGSVAAGPAADAFAGSGG